MTRPWRFLQDEQWTDEVGVAVERAAHLSAHSTATAFDRKGRLQFAVSVCMVGEIQVAVVFHGGGDVVWAYR